MKWRVVVPLFVLFATACPQQPSGDAVKVTLLTAEPRVDVCYSVEVHDDAGAELGVARVAKEEGKTTYVVGVLRGSFPASVVLRARAWVGADCESATKVNGVTDAVTVTFDPKRVVEATLSLERGDADRDGFVSSDLGGLDCDDSNDTVSPAAEEQCSGTIDRDCDGVPSCADSDCAGQPCGGIATQLAFSRTPMGVTVGACSGALDVVVRDAMNQPTSPSVAGALTLSSLPAVTFFAGPDCLGQPLTSVELAALNGFSLRATNVGPVLITASAPALASAMTTVEVLPSSPAGVSLSDAVRAVAGTCSPELKVALVDDAGFPTDPQNPVLITLGSDAGAPFAFYSDLACTQQVTSLSLVDAGQASFYFSGQRAGAFTVTADALPLGFATQLGFIDPAAVAAVQLSTPDGSVLATSGECTGPFGVTAQDAFGNPVTTLQVEVDAGPTTGVFTSSACTTTGGSTNFGLVFSEEGTTSITASAGGVSATQVVAVRHPGPAGSTWRWPLVVNTGPRAPYKGYEGYTLLAAFDSRADVDAGRIDVSGANLRVFFRTDGGWQEVDRLLEGLNTASTLVRFKSQRDLPGDASDTRYSLFSGPFDGGVPAANPESVYLFFDDFESGTLAKWTASGGSWELSDAGPSRGTSLRYGSENNVQWTLQAAPALVESDVMFEAWWNTTNTGDTDFAQCVRMQPGQLTHYETNLEDNAGWNIAREATGTWTELSGNRSGPAQNTWMKIGLSISDRDVRVWRDGVQITPASNSYQVATPAIDAGNVGFRKWDLGGFLYLDDVSARRYTEPEPGVAVGAPFLTP